MKKTFVVSVSGISGGGKTTVSEELSKKLPNATALYFDEYDFDKQPDHLGEWIDGGSGSDAWDLSPLQKGIERILASSDYDFLILDYPFGKKDYPIKPYIDLAVWIDTPLDIALARRIIRDFGNATAEEILNELSGYVARYRKYFIQSPEDRKAYDFVVDGALSVNEICEKIMCKIREVYQ